MFMNDNAFDDDVSPRKSSRKGSHREEISNGVEILSLDDTPKRHGHKSSHSSHPNALKDEDEIDSIVDSNSEYISGSRSNVIQQQRDLQKKKLQERMQGGVVRTSAPKQYSAPRAMDIDDKPSRFGRDDDDDDQPPLRRGNSSRGNENYGRRGSAEEDDDRRGSGGSRRQSNSTRDRDWDRGNSGRDGDRGSSSRDRSDRSEGRDRDRNGRSNDWDRERDRNGRSNDRDRPIRGDRDRNDRSDRDRDRDYDDRDPPRSSTSRGGGRGYKDDVPERRRTSNTKEMDSESIKNKSNSRGLARDYDNDDDNDDDYERRGSAGRKKVTKPRSRSCSRSRSRSPSHSRSPSSGDASSDDEHNDETAATTYDPSSNKPRAAPVKKPKLDMIDMKAFLMRPIPKAYDVVECYIERNKSGANKMFPEYSLFMKEGDRFLLTAKKRPKNRTSNYLISMQRGDLSRHGTDNFLGKLRANFLGTEFTMYDNGTSPKDADQHTITSNPGAIRQELGISMYSPNVLGHRGPRKMRVAVPRVREDGTRVVWRPLTKDDEMVNKCKEQDHTNLTYLINKPPRWNEQVCAYVLNFNGRVTMASVKNFQLVTPEDQETVVLQFGRVGKDLFTMDFRFPLCPFQAFAITLSSFDGKLACE